MKVKRFIASNMQQALKDISEALGPDAVIVSNQRTENGIEVVAGIDASAPAQLSAPEPRPVQAADVRSQDALRDTLKKLQQQRSLKESQGGSSTLESGLQALIQAPPKTVSQTARVQEKPRKPQKPAPARVADDAQSSNVSNELASIKQWMMSQSGHAWGDSQPMSWHQNQLLQRCNDMGLDRSWVEKWVQQNDESLTLDQQWRGLLSGLTSDIKVTDLSFIRSGGVLALVGPTGAGKTTTLSKLAAQCVMHHGADNVALLTLDNYRVAAHDQLRQVARILGTQCLAVPSGGDLGKVLDSLSKKRCILIDTAGLSPQDPHFQTQLSMLKRQKARVESLLVLPLTSQDRCLKENYRVNSSLNLVGCVLSKIDECFSLGGGLSVSVLNQLPLAFVTDGPHTPDDIYVPKAERLVHMAEQMARLQSAREQEQEAHQAAFL